MKRVWDNDADAGYDNDEPRNPPVTRRPQEVATRCPACGKGVVKRIIVSRTFTLEGQSVRIDGLMPDKCTICGELTWSEAELRRADEAIAIKLRKSGT